MLKLCVLQSDALGSVYEDDDSPANIQCHLRRAGYNVVDITDVASNTSDVNANGGGGDKTTTTVSSGDNSATASAFEATTEAETGSDDNTSSTSTTKGTIEVRDVFLKPDNYVVKLLELKKEYDNGQIDCFVNLCDGAWDEPSVGIEIVELLQNKLCMPFTGAGVEAFEPTRLEMKKVCMAAGHHVPSWKFVYSPKELDQFLRLFSSSDDNNKSPPLQFPLIVKHFSSYSSVGLTPKSKVSNTEELNTQCNIMLNDYGGCLIEEYVAGREYTVLATQVPSDDDGKNIDYKVYDAVECTFGNNEEFKHYELKWIDYDNITWNKVADDNLNKRLQKMALDVFKSMPSGSQHHTGYSRLDVRSDPTGEHLYFLETNPNCGIFYPEGLYGSADFILSLEDEKTAHASFILDQVKVAQLIHSKHNNSSSSSSSSSCNYEVRYNNTTKSWGLYATRNIREGEIIQDLEESSFHMVSKQYAIQHWSSGSSSTNDDNDNCNSMKNKMNKPPSSVSSSLYNTWDNFTAYCYPVSDNLFIMWDPNPNNWKPINHSCSPNAWNDYNNSLNVVARCNIPAGEEICMDYATFVGYFPEMKSFPCACGSAECRGTITGVDIIKHPSLALLYEGHMTDYVTSKALSAGILGTTGHDNIIDISLSARPSLIKNISSSAYSSSTTMTNSSSDSNIAEEVVAQEEGPKS